MKIWLALGFACCVVACKGKAKDSPGPASGSSAETGSAMTTGSGSGSASGSSAATPPTGSGAAPSGSFGTSAVGTDPIATPPGEDTPTDLARADDVLPQGERIGGSVVKGDDYRIQVPTNFRRTDQDGHPAYGAKNEDLVPAVTYVVWVTTEPFPGDLDALVAREKAAAAAAGAEEPKVETVAGLVAGKTDPAMSRQFTIKTKDRIEMRTVTVQGGAAYSVHCATANVEGAWAGLAHDCGVRGTSLHVKPPTT